MVPPRRHPTARGALSLAAVGVVVTGVAVSGWWLFSRPLPDSGDPSSPAAPLATVSLTQARVTIGDDGNLRSAAFMFTTNASALHLSVPKRNGLVAGFHPRVGNVRVLAGGRTFELDGSLSPGDTETVPLPAGTSEVRVEYSSTGTFRLSTPSVDDRGLALLTPLSIRESGGKRVRIEVADPRVTNIGCVLGKVMSTCGATDGAGWTVDSDTGQVDVLAQLELDG